jgi:hypothetical protein
MSQPFTLRAAHNRSFVRIGQVLFTFLALLAFAGGSLLLCLGWFGVGMTITGKQPGADLEARAFLFIFLWPITMLAVWICCTIALLLAKRWILASLSLPVAFAIMLGVWYVVASFLLNTSGVMFAIVFFMLNTGAIWLASWFLRSPSR